MEQVSFDGLTGFPRPVDDPSWRLEVDGFEPLREREIESWLTVGNGRTGTRGSIEEGSEESDPAVFVAGLFGRAEDDVGGLRLASGPEWVHLAPRAGDAPVDMDRGETIEHRRVLDLRQGIVDSARRLPADLVLMTWRSVAGAGRARTLKAVTEEAPCPRAGRSDESQPTAAAHGQGRSQHREVI